MSLGTVAPGYRRKLLLLWVGALVIWAQNVILRNWNTNDVILTGQIVLDVTATASLAEPHLTTTKRPAPLTTQEVDPGASWDPRLPVPLVVFHRGLGRSLTLVLPSFHHLIIPESLLTTTQRSPPLTAPEVDPFWDPELSLSFGVFHPGAGRFGNLLFEFASVEGIARHGNRTPWYGDQMSGIQHVFPRVRLKVMPTPPTRWRIVEDDVIYDFQDKFLHLPQEDLVLKGHLCSFRYFQNISHWLYKEVFSTMNPSLVSAAQGFIGSVKKTYGAKNQSVVPKTVCVHVRRGDKATPGGAHAGYRLPEPGDISRAMEHMEHHHAQHQNKVVFIVASDSKAWCHKHLNRHNVFVSTLTNAFEDFALMSSCDDVIMTVGTFGWWASWLTWNRGGTVMYYNHPFIIGSRLGKLFDKKDHFPADWIAYNISRVIVPK